MSKERLKHFLYRRIIPRAGLVLVKLLSATYRILLVDQHREQAVLDRNTGLIYASWHQRFFPGILFFSSRKPIAIIISKSLDGEMIARVVRSLGWHPVRGSSSRGGRQAMAEIRELGKTGCKLGHVVDGPRGPFGVVKPGLIRIAQFTGQPIVPAITSAQKKWTFNSWDRFMVPKPFSRVIIRFADPIHIPSQMSPLQFEQQRRAVEKHLAGLYAETDRIWDDPKKTAALFN
ncbi:MAG: lysophospholipid acyltransferase family protein [Desulfotignum sp.]